jgi:hypothetical protein
VFAYGCREGIPRMLDLWDRGRRMMSVSAHDRISGTLQKVRA